MNTYSVILADPPWSYRAWKGATNQGRKQRNADAHYATMTVREIGELRAMVRNMAQDNCALFLWSTPPNLREALEVIDAWGFTYKTKAFCWVKTTIDGTRPAIGMGHYTRANTEDCLLAIRGSMKVANRSISQVVSAPRSSHSSKPVEVHERIELLYPEARKIELFARPPHRAGWDVWGDESKAEEVEA